MPGIVKNFLDRRLPTLEPFLVLGPGNLTTHPKRSGQNFGRRQLIFSVCGFPEVEHFDPMIDMYRATARVSQIPIIGEILRPASESLRYGKLFPARFNAVMDGLYQAGVEVATNGYVCSETEKNIALPLFPATQSFHQVANRFWDARIRYEQEKKNGLEIDLDNFITKDPGMIMAGMAASYDPERTGGLNKTMQFEFSGNHPATFHIIFTPEQAIAKDGSTHHPDLTIRSPFAVWQKIANKELSGEEAFFNKLYTVEGDVRLLPKMQNIFSQGR